jgi:hypothetical protein
MASALGDRHILAVQTNSTLIIFFSLIAGATKAGQIRKK